MKKMLVCLLVLAGTAKIATAGAVLETSEKTVSIDGLDAMGNVVQSVFTTQ